MWIELPFVRINQLHHRYDQVERGMSVSQVQSIMQEDGVQREPWGRAWWDDELLEQSEDARIRLSLWYSTQTFFLPVSFEFTFNEHGEVVGKHRYD